MNLKRAREEKGLTLIELARRAEVSSGYISDLENGKASNPSMKFMQKVAAALEEKVQVIFFDEE